jgi:hypothetical protein
MGLRIASKFCSSSRDAKSYASSTSAQFTAPGPTAKPSRHANRRCSPRESNADRLAGTGDGDGEGGREGER